MSLWRYGLYPILDLISLTEFAVCHLLWKCDIIHKIQREVEDIILGVWYDFYNEYVSRNLEIIAEVT
jgi:hypothetical protein